MGASAEPSRAPSPRSGDAADDDVEMRIAFTPARERPAASQPCDSSDSEGDDGNRSGAEEEASTRSGVLRRRRQQQPLPGAFAGPAGSKRCRGAGVGGGGGGSRGWAGGGRQPGLGVGVGKPDPAMGLSSFERSEKTVLSVLKFRGPKIKAGQLLFLVPGTALFLGFGAASGQERNSHWSQLSRCVLGTAVTTSRTVAPAVPRWKGPQEQEQPAPPRLARLPELKFKMSFSSIVYECLELSSSLRTSSSSSESLCDFQLDASKLKPYTSLRLFLVVLPE